MADLDDSVIRADLQPAGDLATQQVRDGMAGLGTERRQVHAVTDGGVVAQLGQHHPGTRVPDEHGFRARLLERPGRRRDVILEAPEACGVGTRARQVGSFDAMPTRHEGIDRVVPYPVAAETAVQQQEGGHDGSLLAAGRSLKGLPCRVTVDRSRCSTADRSPRRHQGV
jgi:hypothetical protein